MFEIVERRQIEHTSRRLPYQGGGQIKNQFIHQSRVQQGTVESAAGFNEYLIHTQISQCVHHSFEIDFAARTRQDYDVGAGVTQRENIPFGRVCRKYQFSAPMQKCRIEGDPQLTVHDHPQWLPGGLHVAYRQTGIVRQHGPDSGQHRAGTRA